MGMLGEMPTLADPLHLNTATYMQPLMMHNGQIMRIINENTTATMLTVSCEH